MKVFNLREHDLKFHGQTIPANGGSVELRDLDTFVPDRDRRLADEKVIAFGSLPRWWKPVSHAPFNVQPIKVAAIEEAVAKKDEEMEAPASPKPAGLKELPRHQKK